MKFWYNGHHYTTQIVHNLRSMLWLDDYKGWRWRYLNTTWFGHEDDCCDYWTPITDPKAVRALMLDDELGLTQRLPQASSQTEGGKNAKKPAPLQLNKGKERQ